MCPAAIDGWHSPRFHLRYQETHVSLGFNCGFSFLDVYFPSYQIICSRCGFFSKTLTFAMASRSDSKQPPCPHPPASMTVPQIPSPIHTEQPKLIEEMTLSPASESPVGLRGGGHHNRHHHSHTKRNTAIVGGVCCCECCECCCCT